MVEDNIETTSQRKFDLSVDGLKRQARMSGWSFWRGIVVGFVGGLILVCPVVVGSSFLI